MTHAVAYEGPAGCGKTTRLMSDVEELLGREPLGSGQRVLALTFMNGSRKRLESRLRELKALSGRFHCATLDSFAWHLCHRWRALSCHLGLHAGQGSEFEDTCNSAGTLLERPAVCAWVHSSFPIIVLDEAQDLTAARLRVVAALAARSKLLAAADEFQCLTADLDPNPAVTWLREHADVRPLSGNHRTDVSALIAGGASVRSRGGLKAEGAELEVHDGKGIPFAAWLVASAIRYKRASTVAVVAAAKKGGFASGVVARVGKDPIGKQKIGPYGICWEENETEVTRSVLGRLTLDGEVAVEQVLEALQALRGQAGVEATLRWVREKQAITGRKAIRGDEVRERIAREIADQRRHTTRAGSRLSAMTIHQAKNREFDGVVVLWPYTVGGDAEQKARLLYNGVTRARRWCRVIVQGADLLLQPPFVAG